MRQNTKISARREPDIEPRIIEEAMREGHRLRARAASELLSATGRMLSRMLRAARDRFSPAPARRASASLRGTR